MCLLTRTSKAKDVRRYYIKLEEVVNKFVLDESLILGKYNSFNEVASEYGIHKTTVSSYAKSGKLFLNKYTNKKYYFSPNEKI